MTRASISLFVLFVMTQAPAAAAVCENGKRKIIADVRDLNREPGMTPSKEAALEITLTNGLKLTGDPERRTVTLTFPDRSTLQLQETIIHLANGIPWLVKGALEQSTQQSIQHEVSCEPGSTRPGYDDSTVSYLTVILKVALAIRLDGSALRHDRIGYHDEIPGRADGGYAVRGTIVTPLVFLRWIIDETPTLEAPPATTFGNVSRIDSERAQESIRRVAQSVGAALAATK